jgi:hypothetical protein
MIKFFGPSPGKELDHDGTGRVLYEVWGWDGLEGDWSWEKTTFTRRIGMCLRCEPEGDREWERRPGRITWLQCFALFWHRDFGVERNSKNINLNTLYILSTPMCEFLFLTRFLSTKQSGKQHRWRPISWVISFITSNLRTHTLSDSDHRQHSERDASAWLTIVLLLSTLAASDRFRHPNRNSVNAS